MLTNTWQLSVSPVSVSISLREPSSSWRISWSPFPQTPATSHPSRSLLDRSTMHLSRIGLYWSNSSPCPLFSHNVKVIGYVLNIPSPTFLSSFTFGKCLISHLPCCCLCCFVVFVLLLLLFLLLFFSPVDSFAAVLWCQIFVGKFAPTKAYYHHLVEI